MKTRLDLKSALAGLLVGVLAMLAIGAATPSDSVGRYQIAIGSGNIPVLVDTATGQVWSASSTATQLRNDGDFFQPKAGK